MVRVKICGITSEDDLKLCISCGVDALGFVVEYPVPVPWNLKIENAKILMNKVPPFVSKVAVVGGEYEKVLHIANTLKPDIIQLHGNESLKTTEKLISELKKLKIRVIKAIRFSAETGKLISEIQDPIRLCFVLQNMGADAMLVDSQSESMPAGTGKRVNWEIASKIRASITLPLILAGGLNPENVYEAIKTVRPFAVDVISGVEEKKGKKAPKKVKSFIQEVKKWTPHVTNQEE